MRVKKPGSRLGYAVAQSSVYLYTTFWTDHSQWIEFASWRQSTPISNWSSLVANIDKSSANFERNVRYLAKISPWFYVPVGLVSLWALRRHTKYTLMVCMVIFSLYASVIV